MLVNVVFLFMIIRKDTTNRTLQRLGGTIADNHIHFS